VKKNAEASLRELFSGKGWEAKDNNNVSLFTKNYGDLLGVKAMCEVVASREDIVTCLHSERLSKQSSKPRLVQQVTNDLAVYWFGVKAPIVKDRDFVVAQWDCQQPNGAHLHAFVSVDHPQFPPHPKKKYVRGKIILGAWHIAPVESPRGCKVTWVNLVDPSGTIPSTLKKMGAPLGAESVKRLKDLSEARATNS